MISVWKTRWMQIKKHGFSFVFWSLLPFLLIWLLLEATEIVQEESQIPIGIVLNEDTDMADQLKENLQESTFIHLVKVSEEQAEQMVATHQLDSAFVVEEGYEEAILQGERDNLITAYFTNFSFGYIPVREMIGSFVQEASGKAKAAHTIVQLGEFLEAPPLPSIEEILNRIQEIEISENLVYTSFQFHGDMPNEANYSTYLFEPWAAWSVFALLSTLLLFDWVIRERNAGLQSRFAFIRFSYRQYLLFNVIFYMIALYIVDILTAIGFHYVLHEPFEWSMLIALLSYRVLITVLAFLIANCFRRQLIYYSFIFAIVLIVVTISGVFIPNDGLLQIVPWVHYINPMYAFNQGDLWHPLFVIAIFGLFLWYMKGEK